MTDDALECANCGHANPSWAQVCRSCRAPMRVAAPSAAPSAAPETATLNQGTLLAIGAALGTIAFAVVVGLVVGGILPPAPPVAVATPTPNPTASVEPTPRPTPNASGVSPDPSATLPPTLPGTLNFGLGLNVETQRVTNPSDTFTPGTTLARSIELAQPFGVNQINEEWVRVNEDGSETVVATREDNAFTVDPDASVSGRAVQTNFLLSQFGAGSFAMRIYRGSELLAQGSFILAE